MAEKVWKNPQGQTVPEGMVTDADRMKDELAERLVGLAEAQQADLAAFKAHAMGEMEAARALIFEKYGVKVGGPKGGFAIKSFDGSVEVEVSVTDRIVFGPELQVAKALIDEFIEANAAGANDNIRALVEHAFQVNKGGRIDTQRVLGLRKLQMKDSDGNPDDRWLRAMQAISDALIVDQTATYIRFYRRNEKTNARDQVSLDFSGL